MGGKNATSALIPVSEAKNDEVKARVPCPGGTKHDRRLARPGSSREATTAELTYRPYQTPRFHFAHEDVSLVVLGTGTVGGELLSQIANQCEHLKRKHRIALRVVGLSDSRRCMFNSRGIHRSSWDKALESAGPHELSGQHLAILDQLQRLPLPVLVDCIAAWLSVL